MSDSTQPELLADNFNGDNEKLVGCIEALIKLDADKALVPHGLGGHARELLASAAARLRAPAQQTQGSGDSVAGFNDIEFDDDADEVQTWKGLAISAIMDLRRYAHDEGPERRMVSAEAYEADAVRINAAPVSSEIERLRFELKAAKNEIEIADGEIERLAKKLAAQCAPQPTLREQFEGVITALNYDGNDTDSLTVGEIRRALP